MPIVFFDTETTGIDPEQHEICQIAAISVGDGWVEREAFEVKMSFDQDRATPEALEVNSYDSEVWERHAVDATAGIEKFASFLRRHASVPMKSRRGKLYKVAQLAGHNIAGFDIPFVKRAFGSRDMFMPAAFFGLDTLQLAGWWRWLQPGKPPENLKLQTLSEMFGIDHGDAHDALADVRANVQIAQAMIEALGLGKAPMPPGEP